MATNLMPAQDEEEQRRRELEQFLTMKFEPPQASGFDVGLSKSTATVPIGVQTPQTTEMPYQLENTNPPFDMMAQLQQKQPVMPEVQPMETPQASVKPGVVPIARDANIIPRSEMPESVTNTDMVDYLRKYDDKMNEYDDRIAAARREGPNIGQIIGMGFAGLGEAISGAPYLQQTAKQMESDLGKKAEWLKAEKGEYEERDTRNPESFISKKYRELAARYTNSKPESFAGMSAYQIARVLPTIKDSYEAELKAEQARESRLFQERQLQLKEKELQQKGAVDPTIKRELAKAKVSLASTKPMVEGTIAEIDRVQQLNKNSYGGRIGELQMKIRSGLEIGTESEKFRNTSDVVNTMQSNVAKVLKSTFGGQLSDGEREYLNGVYGALPQLSKVERDVAMTNVKTMLRSKLEGEQSKVDALLADAGIDNTPTQGQAEAVSNEMITVTNGRETFQIDPADEAEAAQEGFRRVQ